MPLVRRDRYSQGRWNRKSFYDSFGRERALITPIGLPFVKDAYARARIATIWSDSRDTSEFGIGYGKTVEHRGRSTVTGVETTTIVLKYSPRNI